MRDFYGFEERNTALFELHGLVAEARLSIAVLNELIRLSGIRQERLSETMRSSCVDRNYKSRKAVANAVRNAQSKHYIFVAPDGTTHDVHGLKQFCECRELNYSGVKAALKACRRYKGWEIKRA